MAGIFKSEKEAMDKVKSIILRSIICRQINREHSESIIKFIEDGLYNKAVEEFQNYSGERVSIHMETISRQDNVNELLEAAKKKLEE